MWLHFLQVFIFFNLQQRKVHGRISIGCQYKSTLGRDYRGKANTTSQGIPCQRWSDQHPHKHSFSHVGDHNYCRNPPNPGNPKSDVWCFTTDPKQVAQKCSVPLCPAVKKALDFSLDNDQKSDEHMSYTYASLEKENFPASFTICTALMVEEWAKHPQAVLYRLHNGSGSDWLGVKMFAKQANTVFDVFIAGVVFQQAFANLYFPLQWTRTCLSVDSNNSRISLVVDGVQLVEQSLNLSSKPENLNIELGWEGELLKGRGLEKTGLVTDINIFSYAEPSEKLRTYTKAGEEMCGVQGDFLSWDDSLEESWWTLHSKARVVKLESGVEGPCRRESTMHVFPFMEPHWHKDCMEHCTKLGGRSPSVRTHSEWRFVYEEVNVISPNPKKQFPAIWLSATEGDIEEHLGEPDHWPEEISAKEGVWRDYYTGKQLENYDKPWASNHGDAERDTMFNCIYFMPIVPETRSWGEWQCHNPGGLISCPCQFETSPIINLRGVCPDSLVEHSRFTIKQLATDPANILMVGRHSARISYNSKVRQWILKDVRQNITAKTQASRRSYALGRNSWTVSGDNHKCSEGKDYTLALKLSACKTDEYTCNDGQCVKMEERCNQMSNCKDDSDEMDCKVLVLKAGYNKRVPPVGKAGKEVKTMREVLVMTSLTLHKVVAIHQEDHSIEFQFKITLEWKENRASYHNLKLDSDFNALSEEEISNLWLPLVIYTNTDQQETTRLGWITEWSTSVRVKRQGNFTRSGFEVLDETEVFKGEENSLIMTQSYTHEFQCIYQLARYPFDTQV